MPAADAGICTCAALPLCLYHESATQPVSSEPLPNDPSANAPPALDGLNWGALALTPFWLIRNGFLLSCLIYLALAVLAGPFAYLISLLFFLRGTKWSWGNGQRWQSYEAFSDSQYTWGMIGKIALILQLVGLAWLIYSIG